MIGNSETRDEEMEQLQKYRLLLKVVDKQQDFLLCEVWSVWLGQLFITANLEKNFGEQVMKIQ